MILSKAEIDQTLRHGPWPPEVVLDPSNRVSGDTTAISLGEVLFSDLMLSRDRTISCASCHDPEQNFTDGLPRAEGRKTLDRNTQALWNLAVQRWYGWSGDSDSLWAQNLTPLLNPDELGHDENSLRAALVASVHRPAYEALFGEMDAEPAVETTVNVSKVLAAYIETLRSGKTSFDQFRDALASGDMKKAAQYPLSAQRGLQIFVGRGNCAFCHSGPAFTNGEFHHAAVPFFLERGGVDPGRAEGIDRLMESPFTLAGEFSDDGSKAGAWAVRNVRFQHGNFGAFRVPTLRRAARTAPYMHDGSLRDLASVIQHYNQIDMERLHSDGEAILRPLGLSDQDAEDLEDFLRTLSDD
ncbi:cytochrome-c peroxidase [Shimia sp. Alg240-R146]|uniref:cytochrome-c peroxidase n=1 Tax=Shimia sp. Alg240-R146 TaxID=2993449 RepID=UPI0022E185D2|nr:cytochrome c peroxidase [Shimia sp. Alg240-R146]